MIPQTRWPRQKKCISHSSGGRKSKIKVPTELASGASSPPGCRWLPLLSSHGFWSVHIQRERELWCLPLHIRTPSCGIRAPTLCPHSILITSLKAPSPGTATSGVRASTHGFGETQFSPRYKSCLFQHQQEWPSSATPVGPS